MSRFYIPLLMLLGSVTAYGQSDFTIPQSPKDDFVIDQAAPLPEPADAVEVPDPEDITTPTEVFDTDGLPQVDPNDLVPVPQPKLDDAFVPEPVPDPNTDKAPEGLSSAPGITPAESAEIDKQIATLREQARKAQELADQAKKTAAAAQVLLDAANCKPATGLKSAGLGSPGYVNRQQQRTSTNSDRTPRDNSVEQRLASLEGRMGKVETRVDRVEEQLRALVTVRYNNGQVKSVPVEIDHVSGYGDLQVPKGGKVIAIDGVSVNRVTPTAVPQTTVYTTGTYVASPGPVVRSVRIRPMQSPPMTRMYYSNGNVVTGTGAPIGWNETVRTSQRTGLLGRRVSSTIRVVRPTSNPRGNCVNCN